MQPQGRPGSSLPGQTDPSHLETLPLAAVAVDWGGVVVYANPAATGLYGGPPEELVGTPLLQVAFGDQERGAAEEVLAQVLAGEGWSGDLMALSPADEERPVQVSGTPLRRDGVVVGALLIAQDGAPGRAKPRQTARFGERLARLARVAAELVMADHVEAVTKIVISHAADAAGATIASLSLLADKDTDTLVLQGLRGGLDGAASRWATYPVHANTPVSEAVRTGHQVLLIGNAQIRERYPDLESAATGERTMICLPLKVTTRTIGAISLSFPGLRHLDAAELEFLGILADICAQALDRIKAVAEAADQRLRLEFLAHASAELASSLDYEATLSKVAKLAVPTFADWCAIAVAEDGELHTLAVAHVDPAKVALAEELQRRYPSDPDTSQGTYHVLRTGVSELLPEITDEMLVAGTQDEEHLRLARDLNLRSALVVPLVARGKVLGVITWVSGEGGRRFDRGDVAFAEDLARRAATAIDNAQLHSETYQAAARLQQAVLPETLPAISGWDLAVHYSPSGRTEVGGDFYDVVPLADGAVALFVGDVEGRGVTAAAAMSQVRSAVRAYLAIDPHPSSVIGKLDVMFATYDLTRLVTLVYAVAYPDRDELWTVNAGHPPPVLVRADGSVEQLPLGDHGPLGFATTSRNPVVRALHPGDAVLAFTDGLIERRTEDIDEGQRRVVESCHLLASADLARALDDLVESVRDHTREDDIAALVARRTG
ncbi:MAG TPA: SpoIIE family protein phosphatase [Nocardioidaceae bacterium]|nr:SpoIIE family protein phosphatase [Nocardioidaceae bacterium]